MPDYSTEPPITRGDRTAQRKRASRFPHWPAHALTVECRDEADQQALYKQLAARLKGRRIRVVVA